MKLARVLPGFGITSWWILLAVAWALNMFVTGVFAFAGFALPTQRVLPKGYYRVRCTKLLRRSYDFLNVELFRKFLLLTIWRDPDRQRGYFDGTRLGLDNFLTQSEKSECGHLWPFVILSGITVWYASTGQWLLAVAVMGWNVLGNFYPIVLQRYHRMRVARLQGLMTGE